MNDTPSPQQDDTQATAEQQAANRARLREIVAATLAEWQKRWPAVFTKPVPLAVGAARLIRAELRHEMPSRHVSFTLYQWTGRRAYLEALARGDMRRNLDGSEAGIPTAEAQARARQLLAEREQRTAERRASRR